MSIEHLRSQLVAPPLGAWPDVRWWLAGGAHTDETLRREVADMRAAGYGGVEFLAMEEQGVDDARYGWGSEEWTRSSHSVVEYANAHGMSVSFTSGTNWAHANLPDLAPGDPAASQELDASVEVVEATGRRGPLRRSVIVDGPDAGREPPVQSFVAAVAARASARTERGWSLDLDSVTDLTAEVRDGDLAWCAPDDGEWILFAFWMHGTGQTAQPSVGVNHAVNYVDADGFAAVMRYWDAEILTPAMRAALAENPRPQMYMDSLELRTYGWGGLLWGHSFVEEFRRRRGYDVRPWLPFLVRTNALMAVHTVPRNEPTLPAIAVEEVRHDYAETLTDLYIENVLRPFRRFLNDRGMQLRAEISYGAPYELTRPGPEVDGIETESLEFGSQIDGYRLLSAPAHLFGRVFSSETGATTKNHVLDHRFYDQIIATQLAAGVTRTVMHGWSSPAGPAEHTAWPGHEGMWPAFSERFDTRQPSTEFSALWAEALARVQHVLGRGKPRVDVGILRTGHYTDNFVGLSFEQDGMPADVEEAYGRMGMRDRDNFWWRDMALQDAGWTYEFLDGALLSHPDVRADGVSVQESGPGYRALVVFQETLALEAAREVLRLAELGLPVVFVDGAEELVCLTRDEFRRHRAAALRTPGHDGRDAELADVVARTKALANVRVAADPSQTLAQLRALGVESRTEVIAGPPTVLTRLREEGDLLHLYLYNYRYLDAEASETTVQVPGEGAVFRHDPWRGTLDEWAQACSDGGRTAVTVELAPGETALFTIDRGASPRADTPRMSHVERGTIDSWKIRVESWDAGPVDIVEQDRGRGYRTVEWRPTTRVEVIECHSTELAPWHALAEVGPEVSGVGEYEASFVVAAADLRAKRLVLDLGSTSGGRGSVRVNGATPRGFDTSRPVVDITDHVHEGLNSVVVRVASSLNNRLLARGYYDEIPDRPAMRRGVDRCVQTSVRPYGLQGPVRLLAEVPPAG